MTDKRARILMRDLAAAEKRVTELEAEVERLNQAMESYIQSVKFAAEHNMNWQARAEAAEKKAELAQKAWGCAGIRARIAEKDAAYQRRHRKWCLEAGRTHLADVYHYATDRDKLQAELKEMTRAWQRVALERDTAELRKSEREMALLADRDKLAQRVKELDDAYNGAMGAWKIAEKRWENADARAMRFEKALRYYADEATWEPGVCYDPDIARAALEETK